MADIDKLIEELKTKRDELALQIHLGSKEAQDEWNELEAKWNDFSAKAKLEDTADGLSSAAELLSDELKQGYERIKKAL